LALAVAVDLALAVAAVLALAVDLALAVAVVSGCGGGGALWPGAAGSWGGDRWMTGRAVVPGFARGRRIG